MTTGFKRALVFLLLCVSATLTVTPVFALSQAPFWVWPLGGGIVGALSMEAAWRLVP